MRICPIQDNPDTASSTLIHGTASATIGHCAASCGVPAVTDLDTRALVRHIRDHGAMRGGLFPVSIAEQRAREMIAREAPISGRDLARDVTPKQPVILTGSGPRIAMIDTGVKLSIVRNLLQRGATVELQSTPR